MVCSTFRPKLKPSGTGRLVYGRVRDPIVVGNTPRSFEGSLVQSSIGDCWGTRYHSFYITVLLERRMKAENREARGESLRS